MQGFTLLAHVKAIQEDFSESPTDLYSAAADFNEDSMSPVETELCFSCRKAVSINNKKESKA